MSQKKTKYLTLKFTANEIEWLLIAVEFADSLYPVPDLEQIIAKLRAKIKD